MSSNNPFDVIATFVDGRVTYEENCKKLEECLKKGEIPLEVACSVLASAVSMPSLYAELLKTKDELQNCRYDLEDCLATLAMYQAHERKMNCPSSKSSGIVN